MKEAELKVERVNRGREARRLREEAEEREEAVKAAGGGEQTKQEQQGDAVKAPVVAFSSAPENGRQGLTLVSILFSLNSA